MDPNLYATWRASSPVLAALNETTDPPPERLLQHIWLHQRLARESLVLSDGRPLRVLHPGFWNRSAGPDFQDAVIQIGEDPPRVGDVEIDLVPGGWRAHSHEGNPAYAKVILHAVWQAGGTTGFPVATMAIRDVLDAPVQELADWAASGELRMPAALIGKCRAPLGDLGPDAAQELLCQAARERLRHKAEALRARARRSGWDQALWEGLFGALGYRNNTWPMRRLAELLPRLEALGPLSSEPAVHWQARLLGTAGWLPPVAVGEGATYVRRLWDAWWRERDAVSDAVLPPGLWRLGALRPANHPQRRLVLAGHWLAWGDMPRRLEAWFREARASKHPEVGLLHLLRPDPDAFWSEHWTFASRDAAAAAPLIGAPRVTDLAVNVILPWFWARAAAGRHRAGCEDAERVYFEWPPSEDNAVLRKARLRIFGCPRGRERNASAQQGLLQIVWDFCEHSNPLCDDCRLPGLPTKETLACRPGC
jgi:hypothetical protein